MKSFPHYSQHDVMDCGPTCLRMVSAFYGKRYSLEGLREKSFITREGVSMLGISEAAEKIGFRSICVQVSYEMLQEAPLPCIVHWNQQHFVVVYRMNDKHVWVADPGAGKLKYTREEFCRCWLSAKTDGEDTGVALLLEPTPEFYAQEDEGEKTNYKGFGFLYSYLRPYKQLVGQLLLGLLLGSMIQLMLPFLTQSIVDFGINNQNLGFIYLVLIAQLMLSFSSSAVEFIRGWILLHLGTRINIALISDFLIKMMKLPMGYFDTKMTGDILQRINDHTRIQNFLTGSSLSVAFSTFNILIFGIVLLVYSGMIFLIFMGGSALYISYVWLFMKKRAELDHKRFAQQSANQSTVVQLVNGMQGDKAECLRAAEAVGMGTHTGTAVQSEHPEPCAEAVPGLGSGTDKPDQEHSNHGTGGLAGGTRGNDTGHDALRAVHHRTTEQSDKRTHHLCPRHAGRAPQHKPPGRGAGQPR